MTATPTARLQEMNHIKEYAMSNKFWLALAVTTAATIAVDANAKKRVG